jgi:acetyl-CoA acetyltransferase
MRKSRAAELGVPCVEVLATSERHNAFPDDAVQLRGGWLLDRAELFAQAGVSHDDIDFVQTYDDYPVISFLQLEDLGFCGKGEAPQFVRDHTLTATGTFPHNTCGGQLSVGQAGAAGGFLGMVEAIRQLTGQALGARVPDVRIGVVSGFGMINYDRGVSCGATILAASTR